MFLLGSLSPRGLPTEEGGGEILPMGSLTRRGDRQTPQESGKWTVRVLSEDFLVYEDATYSYLYGYIFRDMDHTYHFRLANIYDIKTRNSSLHSVSFR